MLRTALASLLAAATVTAVAAAAPGAPPPRVTGWITWVSWAPGPTILFEADGVWSVRANGSGLRRLTPINGWDPSWSPDGRRIAVSWGDSGNSGIAVMNADGTGRRHLRRTGEMPMWSPDGQRIAFLTRDGSFTINGVWTMNSEGRVARQVAALRYGTNGPREHDWSQDGRRLVFSQCLRRVPETDLCYSHRGGVGVFTAPVDGRGPPRRISRGQGWCPDWGTEGRIAFNGDRGIVVSRADGSRPRVRVARTTSSCATWSPNGRLLAVQGETSLLLARAGGGRPWRLRTLPPLAIAYPLAPSSAWSPDGRWIAVARPVVGRKAQVSYRLYVVDVETGRFRVVAEARVR